MARVILDAYEAKYIYEYSFDELLQNNPYNPDIEKFRIDLRLHPILLDRLSLQFRKIMSYSECQAQATRLGCAKLQHDKRIINLTSQTNKIISSDDKTFEMFDLMHAVGYPYATDTTCIRQKITVNEWVEVYIKDNYINLGLPKSQLAILCFFEGISDYSLLSDSRLKSINKELNKFWEYIEHKTIK